MASPWGRAGDGDGAGAGAGAPAHGLRGKLQLYPAAAESVSAPRGEARILRDRCERGRSGQKSVKVVLAHEQIVREQVNVTASSPGIDTEQASDQSAMNTPEIVNIPYQTSRDIRYLLPFNPGVVQDATEQVHVAGSETWETLDTMDGFDIRSPAEGTLDMRVSPDAVRSIDSETTRYPVEFGRATGGVMAFYTGMGDNKFRFNATNFIPSFRDLNGIRFDKFVPRFTFSGPLKRDRAWFYDGAEAEYDNIYISELPANADTDELVRGSNLVKAQANLSPKDILTAGLLFNDYHSPYEGISSLTPQQSTTKRDVIAWLPYLRGQLSFGEGALLDVGVGEMRFRDGHEPHGSTPYEITPEIAEGSYFEDLTGRSQRLEGTVALYLPPHHWMGRHDLKAGLDLDHIRYNQDQSRAPVSYLREGPAAGVNGTLDRQSVFAPAAPFTMHNAEIGAYLQDRWQPAKGWLGKGWLLEPGLRFDWDEIIRRPLASPRLAAVYSRRATKTQPKSRPASASTTSTRNWSIWPRPLRACATTRTTKPMERPLRGRHSRRNLRRTTASLHEPRALNWSVGVERKLPWSIIGGANFVEKRTSNVLTFANQSAPRVARGRLSADERPAGPLRLRGVRAAAAVCQWLHRVCVVHALLRAYQCGAELFAHAIATWGPAERAPGVGHTQSRDFVGLVAGSDCEAQKALGFCVPDRLSYRVPVHRGQRGRAGGGRGGWSALSRLRRFQPWAGMEVSLSRPVLGLARRDGECDGQRKSRSGQQCC